MSADKYTQNANIPTGLRKRTWLYFFMAMLILAGFAYFSLINTQNSLINHDLYRVLYEASKKFNDNLNTLESMHLYNESEASIRSRLPSYQRSRKPATSNSKVQCAEKSICYQLQGQNIEVSAFDYIAELDINDILPTTQQGFSQYLFADQESKVLANIGGEKTISIVDLGSINRQIIKQNQQFNFEFSKNPGNNSSDSAALPNYSSHVDMQLSYGEFRIFIFPFSLATPLQYVSDGETKILDKLFLVGLLPKQQLQAKSSGQWNVSLLVVSLAGLLFMWVLIRLILLPENQSITRIYRTLSQVASYLFYVVFVALILSYLSKSGLQAHKDQSANDYANELAVALKKDLEEVFNELSTYRGFYSHFATTVEALSKQPMTAEETASESQENSQSSNVSSNFIAPTNLVDEDFPCSDTNKPIKPTLVAQLPNQVDMPSWSLAESFKVFNQALQILANDRSSMCVGCSPQLLLPTLMTTNNWQATLRESPNSVQTPYFGIQESADDRLYKSPQDELGLISFFAGHINGEFDYQNSIFRTFVENTGQQKTFPTSKIFTIFATDAQGIANLPSIYFQESNAKPQTFNLSHRDYFKRVRDYRGWFLDFSTAEQQEQPAKQFRNVFIQRLLNINDGTRGTTISMPMHQPRLDMPKDMSVAGYILGADVILPSVSLASPPPYDFTFMLVDRDSGDVLFHSDESRSLVENLFFAGNNDSQLSQWIKAGLDQYPFVGGNQIKGFYHGQPGRFSLTPSIVDAWAVVVFSPDDSLDSFMTNQFMYITVSFLLLLTASLILTMLASHWSLARSLKKRMALPKQLDNKRIMLMCTALFTSNYGFFYISQLLQVNTAAFGINSYFSLIIPFTGLFLLLFFIQRFYIKYFCYRLKPGQDNSEVKKGAKILVIGFGITALLHFSYLQFSAAMPLKNLHFNYQQQACNGINKEVGELTNMALSRYPNSVTVQRISPFTLLPLNADWRKQIEGSEQRCAGNLSVVEPDDYPKQSTLVSSSFVWKWINTYLLHSAYPEQKLDTNIRSTQTEYGLILLSVLALFALVWVWFYFNRKVLWTRIYCPSGFLTHIRNLSTSVANMSHDIPNENLQIKIDTFKLNGIGLALLLRSQQLNDADSSSGDELLPGFTRLFKLSPCLRQFSASHTILPNLKLDLASDPNSQQLQVKIWDIESCLEKTEFRQLLLDLIMEIKSLTLAGKLQSFTIYSGFLSLRRVKMKDPLSAVAGSVLEHAEYLSWSECLMDFTVQATDSFRQNLDIKLLSEEINCMPELCYLAKGLPEYHTVEEERSASFWSRKNPVVRDSEWATINYVLLHADALYRFKWESCSSAEKLALYNLAHHHRLNPGNTDMIEHLAINSMIKVEHDYLVIINKSFAQFVLHAETNETIATLVQQGEAGIWKNYRVPLGLLILLIVGGIALTSGESIFIIIASLAGVLGTLGSLTSSVGLLRGKFRD